MAERMEVYWAKTFTVIAILALLSIQGGIPNSAYAEEYTSACPSVFEVDSWRFQVEYVLHYICNELTPVILCTGAPNARQRNAIKSLQRINEECAYNASSFTLLYSPDDANPFVSLYEYFQAPFRVSATEDSTGAICTVHVRGDATSLYHYAAKTQHCPISPSGNCSFETKEISQVEDNLQSHTREYGKKDTFTLLLKKLGVFRSSDTIAQLVLSFSRPQSQLVPESAAEQSWWPCMNYTRRNVDEGVFGSDSYIQPRFKVYIYPPTGYPLSRAYEQYLNQIRSEAQVTKDPTEACLFFPSFDTTPLGPYTQSLGFGTRRDILERLRSLPHWNNGRGHIILDWTDSRCTYTHFDNAVVWKSGFDRQSYERRSIRSRKTVNDRPFDVVIPLPPLVTAARPTWTPQRRYLASFRGTPWKLSNGTSLRLDVINKLDIRCKLKMSASKYPDVIVELEPYSGNNGSISSQEIRYSQLMSSSSFALICRGDGLHSYRLMEAIHFGAIPIILSDSWLWPFSVAVLEPRTTEKSDLTSLPSLFRFHTLSFSRTLPVRFRRRWIGYGLLYAEDEVDSMLQDIYSIKQSALVKRMQVEMFHIHSKFLHRYIRSSLLQMKSSMLRGCFECLTSYQTRGAG